MRSGLGKNYTLHLHMHIYWCWAFTHTWILSVVYVHLRMHRSMYFWPNRLLIQFCFRFCFKLDVLPDQESWCRCSNLKRDTCCQHDHITEGSVNKFATLETCVYLSVSGLGGGGVGFVGDVSGLVGAPFRRLFLTSAILYGCTDMFFCLFVLFMWAIAG